MTKRDNEKRIDRTSPVISGEMVAVASVTQIQHLTISGPYSGDFQIVDNGRLIVGADPDIGARVIVSPKGMFGYSAAGTNTFSLWTSSAPNGDNTPGDLHLGNLAANYLLYDHSEGTFGLYTPAGAGVLLDNDGSARFGHPDGGHMLWDSASQSLKIKSGTVVVSEIDALGNAAFTGIITATGGRITGDMQVDAMLRAGDVDGPAVYVGKLVDEGGAAYAGYIGVTDTENVPWFVVRTGDDGTGHLQIGRPGDYPNRLTLDVTPTGSTLVYDGTAYIAAGEVAGWTISAQQLVSPSGYVTLDSLNGAVFTAYDHGAGLSSDAGDDVLIDRMISYIDTTGNILHRIEAYSDTAGGDAREVLNVHASNEAGRAYLTLRSIATGEAWSRLRAVGGWDLAGQQDASVHVYAYREGRDHSRIHLDADTTQIKAWTGAAAPDPGTGALPDGLLIYNDGAFDPVGFGSTALAEGLYMYCDAAWVKIAGPLATNNRWGDYTNYAQVDHDGVLTFAGVGRIAPRYATATVTGTATISTVTYTRCNSTSGAFSVTLPTAAGITGRVYTIKKVDSSANAVTVDGDGSETIDGATTYALATQYKSVTVISNGSAWEIIAAT